MIDLGRVPQRLKMQDATTSDRNTLIENIKGFAIAGVGVGGAYIDVLGEQLVRHAVFLHDVVPGCQAGGGGAEEEAKDSAVSQTLALFEVSWV